MKRVIYSIFFVTATFLFSCDPLETNEIAEPNAMSGLGATDEQGVCSASRASCDNDLAHNGCEFTSGEHTYTGDLADEFELLLNNCFTEPLPSNCSWSGYQTDYELYYHGLTACCYDFNAYNFRLDQIKSVGMVGRPASNWLIIGYDVNYLTSGPPSGYPTFQVKVTYRKRGLCSISAEDVKIAR